MSALGLGRVKAFVDIGFEGPSEEAGIMGLATASLPVVQRCLMAQL
jgi:hypothetical protein